MSVSFGGLTPTNAPTNTRNVIDANFSNSTALPASASSVTSTAFDLGGDNVTVAVGGGGTPPYATTETINLQVNAPVLNTTQLPNASTVTYTVQDSADNSSFAAIATLGTTVQTGAGGTGAAAAAAVYKLPPITRRYVRVQATAAGSPGASMANSNLVVQLAF